jgi:hypothetical protein
MINLRNTEIFKTGHELDEFSRMAILRIGYFCDTMGERMGRIGRIRTDFFLFFTDSKHTRPKKSVCIRPIRPIRSPIVSQNHRVRSIYSYS